MSKNRLMIASAGAGKTTFLVKAALKQTDNVLITTYTEANEAEIRRKIIKLNKSIPENITVQTWFSFLIQHGVKPYQGCIWDKRIKGLCFVNTLSGFRFRDRFGRPVYYGEADFERYYFNKQHQIFSDKLSKFVLRCNEHSEGNVIERISRIYPHIYIDEVQDLAGYDLDIIGLLFQSKSKILLVGDPRQATYVTHPDRRHSQYSYGMIERFVVEQCKGQDYIIDTETLRYSHRNNAQICDFSSLLYPDFTASAPCSCPDCRLPEVDHTGIFIVKPSQVDEYMTTYRPTVLRYKEAQDSEWTFGRAKGLGFDRVLIVPTDTFIPFLYTGDLKKTDGGKEKNAFDIAKYYVATTRARHSVAIVHDYNDDDTFIVGVNKYTTAQ